MINRTFVKIFSFALSLMIVSGIAINKILTSNIQTNHKTAIVIATLILLLVLCIVFSVVITKSIVKPVIKLGNNLDNLDKFKTYKEFEPLLNNLKEQQQQQLLADKQKKQFTANVSHELKTPLTSIAGYAELIENGMAKEEDIKPFAHTIRKQALRLVTLTEDIIQLSQLDEAEDKVVFEEIDLYKITQNCIKALEMNALSKNVTMNLQGEECYIKGNFALVEELVYNLCDNAIKYNKQDGIVTAKVIKSEKGGTLIVSDTGIGIAEKYQTRIFERFFRVDKSRSKETGGTGLGLAIVKHIAKVHSADLTLESKKDIGTIITIKFNK